MATTSVANVPFKAEDLIFAGRVKMLSRELRLFLTDPHVRRMAIESLRADGYLVRTREAVEKSRILKPKKASSDKKAEERKNKEQERKARAEKHRKENEARREASIRSKIVKKDVHIAQQELLREQKLKKKQPELVASHSADRIVLEYVQGTRSYASVVKDTKPIMRKVPLPVVAVKKDLANKFAIQSIRSGDFSIQLSKGNTVYKVPAHLVGALRKKLVGRLVSINYSRWTTETAKVRARFLHDEEALRSKDRVPRRALLAVVEAARR